jgi:hypothetical protein
LDNFGLLVLGRMKDLTKKHSGGKVIIDDELDKTVDFTLVPDKV